MIFISIKLTQYLRKCGLQKKNLFSEIDQIKSSLELQKGIQTAQKRKRNSMSSGPAVESCVVNKTELVYYTTN